MVETGEEAPNLPRLRLASCKETGAEERTLRTCQEEPADLPGSERRLLITDPQSTEYEIHWQDERTLEFRDYKSGEVLRFGCSPDSREWVRTDVGMSSTKMLDDVCAAARYFPLERLAVSPQCGFSTSVIGNAITVDDERCKLRTLVERAGKIWG